LSLNIKSRFPLFWHAIFPSHVKTITWPMCRSCKKWIKSPTTLKRCNWCGSNDVSDSPRDGARTLQLEEAGDKRILTEFDEKGRERVNFKFLSSNGMKEFGLVDLLVSPHRYYNINLETGHIIFESDGVRFPVNPSLSRPTLDGGNCLQIGGREDRYGDIFHLKHAVRGGTLTPEKKGRDIVANIRLDNPDAATINCISIGYRFSIPEASGSVILSVNCDTHLPRLMIKEDDPK